MCDHHCPWHACLYQVASHYILVILLFVLYKKSSSYSLHKYSNNISAHKLDYSCTIRAITVLPTFLYYKQYPLGNRVTQDKAISKLVIILSCWCRHMQGGIVVKSHINTLCLSMCIIVNYKFNH